ncbi:hypothetical protein OEZ86_002820 [Tetradesmus obliquus]|nr:hypothetical protein OEZ86_002820 [Tetradesmus obliquus]
MLEAGAPGGISESAQASEQAAVEEARAAAVAALCALPGANCLNSQDISRWLSTALQHSWVEAAAHLCSTEAAAELPAASVEDLVWQLLRREDADNEAEAGKKQQLQEAVCSAVAAQKLGPGTVMRMLCFVINRGNLPAVKSLCGLTGAAQLDAAGAAQLLGAAVRMLLARENKQAAEIVAALCVLKGAQRLDAAAVGELLRDAIMANSSKAMAALCKLPAAAQAPADMLQDLLQLAAQAGRTAVAKQPAAALLRIPNVGYDVACVLIRSGLRLSYADVLAAAKQGVYGVEAWVAAAYTVAKETAAFPASGMPGLAIAICRLVKPGSGAGPTNKTRRKLQQQLSSPAAAEQLVDAMFLIPAMADASAAVDAFRCLKQSEHFRSLPAMMSVETVVLMRVAAARYNMEMMQYLAAGSLSSAEVGELLTMALNHCWEEAKPVLLQLPSARGIAPNVARELLFELMGAPAVVDPAAAACGEQLAIKLILGLAAVQQLGAADVQEVLSCAVSGEEDAAVTMLCGLPGAAQIDAAGVAELLRLALYCLWGECDSSSVVSVVATLCTLSGARQLDAAAVAELLTDAVAAKSSAVVKALFRLPAAAHIGVEGMRCLQQLAAQAAVLAAASSEQHFQKHVAENAERGYRSRPNEIVHGEEAAARDKHAVAWLCSKAGSAALADEQLVAALLRVPQIGPGLASTLIQSGLGVTYAAISEAAKQGVYGVESWVSAAYAVAKEDGAASSMPGLAVAICRMAKAAAYYRAGAGTAAGVKDRM